MYGIPREKAIAPVSSGNCLFALNDEVTIKLRVIILNRTRSLRFFRHSEPYGNRPIVWAITVRRGIPGMGRLLILISHSDASQ